MLTNLKSHCHYMPYVGCDHVHLFLYFTSFVLARLAGFAPMNELEPGLHYL